jgi:hypothetical protein
MIDERLEERFTPATNGRVIQLNGDRHYSTDHGTYIIISFWEGFGEGWKTWEVFAPDGRNFSDAHSLLEESLKDAKQHIGDSEPCEIGCGCEYEPTASAEAIE